MAILEDCGHYLYELKRETGWWRSGFEELKEKLEGMISFSKEVLKQEKGVRFEASRAILPRLKSLQEKIGESELDEFLKAAEKAREILKDEFDRDEPNSFYNTLHSFKNIPLALLSNSKEVKKIVERCLSNLKGALSNGHIKLLQDLESCFESIKGGVTAESISKVESILTRWQNMIPQVTLSQRGSNTHVTPVEIEKVVIIEDQQIWSDPVIEVIAEKFPDLGNKISCWRTYDEANKNIKDLRRVELEQREGILVISDLGLPKDDNELKSGASSRIYGKKLLSELRSYSLNIRTILLTSHFDFLEDHRWALNNGIAPEDYIWKGVEDYRERVKNCIRRVIETERGVSRIEIFEKDGYGSVTIDNVEIQLDPLYFKTFSILCAQRFPKSCREILELLKDEYREDHYKDYDPELIHDHIYQIRKKIQETFNRVGSPVAPYLIIETVFVFLEKKYQIRRGINRSMSGEFGHEVAHPSSVSVLVIENDFHWCKMVKEFLNELGYETEIAHSVDEGVEKAKEKYPALLCLDMHIPKDQEEWKKNPESGQIENGFRALEEVRGELGDDIGVAVLTDHYEKNELRDIAIQKGIDINHWVGKDENWADNLAYAVWRLARGFQLGVKTPAEDDIYSHLRIQLNGSNRRVIFIDGVEFRVSENRSKLLWTLAESRIPVPRINILVGVYGENQDKWPKDEKRALNSLVDDTRRDIGEALHGAGKQQLDPRKIIVEMPGGYKFKGLVFISVNETLPLIPKVK